MTLKKKIRSRMLLSLRSIGLLCKRPVETTHRIRISQTRNPDGSITHHKNLTKQPLIEGSTFETELHIWKEIHKQNK
jgi:hypothetical protein